MVATVQKYNINGKKGLNRLKLDGFNGSLDANSDLRRNVSQKESNPRKNLSLVNSVLEPEPEPPRAALFGWSQSRSRKNYAVSAPAPAPL